jgi:hypothetical protein
MRFYQRMCIDVSPPVSRRDRGEIGAACGCGAALAELRARLEAVELRLPPQRPNLEAAIVAAVPAGLVFGIAELHRHASLHKDLAAALEGLSPKGIGARLRRMSSIARVGRDGAGVLWAVQ